MSQADRWWQSCARELLSLGRLTERQVTFLEDMAGRYLPPTEKQAIWIASLWSKRISEHAQVFADHVAEADFDTAARVAEVFFDRYGRKEAKA
jgi:hypothetical protein